MKAKNTTPKPSSFPPHPSPLLKGEGTKNKIISLFSSLLPSPFRRRVGDEVKGFTLVELIVVITILVILGTIGFIQLQGFTGSARDSVRIENLSNLHKGLSLFNVTSGTYPMPEGPVTISASGTDIGYQGFAKDLVGSIAKLSAGATKDPLDPSIYTTYSVSANKTKMQLMAFLEDGSSVTTFVPNAYASAGSDYSKRSPMVKGDTLGILLTSGSLQPVQESGIGVDLINATGSYVMQFDKDTKISGTGIILKSGIVSTKGLVGYWDMETTTLDGKLMDLSGNGNSGTGNGIIMPGLNGKGVLFNGTTSSVIIEHNSVLNPTNQITVSSWVFFSGWYTGNCGVNSLISKGPDGDIGSYRLGVQDSAYSCTLLNGIKKPQFLLRFMDGTLNFVDGINSILTGRWYFMAGTYDGSNLKLYLDGHSIGSLWVGKTLGTNNKELFFGKMNAPGYTYNLDGSLDEVRIYNRALSDFEIQTLYNSTK